MPTFVPRAVPAWCRQLAGLPPAPVPAPVGGLVCARLLIAPAVVNGVAEVGGAALEHIPLPVGFVQRAPVGAGITVRLRGLADDATGAPVASATVALGVTDAAGGTVTTIATFVSVVGADAQAHGDYDARLAALPAGRYTITAVATDTPAGGVARQLTVTAVVVVGPYYGGEGDSPNPSGGRQGATDVPLGVAGHPARATQPARTAADGTPGSSRSNRRTRVWPSARTKYR